MPRPVGRRPVPQRRRTARRRGHGRHPEGERQFSRAIGERTETPSGVAPSSPASGRVSAFSSTTSLRSNPARPSEAGLLRFPSMPAIFRYFFAFRFFVVFFALFFLAVFLVAVFFFALFFLPAFFGTF